MSQWHILDYVCGGIERIIGIGNGGYGDWIKMLDMLLCDEYIVMVSEDDEK